MLRLCLVSLLSLLGIVYTHDTGLTPQHITQDPQGDSRFAALSMTSGKSSHEGPLVFDPQTSNNVNDTTKPVHDRNTVRHASIEAPSNNAGLKTEVRTKEPANIYTEDENNMLKAQIEEFKRKYNEGRRVMVILRGAPGSGKSYLAKKLLNTIISRPSDYKKYIFEIDDFFTTEEGYIFDINGLFQAIRWNIRRVSSAAVKGLSPIIVEGLNLVCWQVELYLRAGVENGYSVQIMEPRTPWAKNTTELARRNVHGVSMLDITLYNMSAIEDCTEMLQKYDI